WCRAPSWPQSQGPPRRPSSTTHSAARTPRPPAPGKVRKSHD
ncbi:MAG: hypothetical protein AVDCRST_MAG58-1286, partial [uncultured Rubrobacteraceae bacterium]